MLHKYSVKNSQKLLRMFASLFFILLLICKESIASDGVGFRISGGAGLFVASESQYYGDISTDLYPEIGLQINVAVIRLGIKTGLIYRKYEQTVSFYDPFFGQYSSRFEYTTAFLPIQGELLLAPLDFSEDMPISPYVGIMAGVFLAVGDNDKTLPAFSAKVGSDFNLAPLFLYGDVRYTYANDGDFEINAGGFMIVAGMGIDLLGF